MIWKRTRQSHKDKQDLEQRLSKQADLDMLELAAATGEIHLKYLDESGFCLWSPVTYSYIKRGQRKRLEQTQRRGRRLSICGLWEPDVSFEYGLAVGSFTTAAYIRLMDWAAHKAALKLQKTGTLTVVVQDNGAVHTSKDVQDKWREWQEKGLYIFFLPKYCSQMNRIENEWQQLKSQELGGRMFEDEYDLATAVIDGVKERGQQGGYATERFKFNSAVAFAC